MARRRSTNSRGSTVVEVLMAITVLAIGASGIIALQKAAAVANRNSKSLAIANEISRTWAERLRTDAMLWNHPSTRDPAPDLDNDTTWLAGNVADPGEEVWFQPSNGVPATGTDPAIPATICGIHDPFGRDDACDGRGPFCVNLRLSWVREERKMIRAEVRVHWVNRNVGDGALTADELPCGDPEDVEDLAKVGVFHTVYLTTALTKNEAR